MQPVEPVPPSSQAPLRAPDPGFPRFSHLAAAAAVLALTPLAASFASALFELRDDDVAGLHTLSLLAAGVGFVLACVATVRLSNAPEELRLRGRMLAVGSIPLSICTGAWGLFIAVVTSMSFSRGRQLRERGAPVFAELVERDTWLRTTPTVDVPPDVASPAELADAWRENGKTEHASVAAFAALSNELVALGAPAQLIEAAHKDALDEIGHARLCFSLARAIDGRSIEPGALPAALPLLRAPLPRSVRLARLAIESLLDGALNEGTSARAVARLLRRVDEPEVRAVLTAIARDEGRHASHGWDVLAWCIAEGGETVRGAVRGALRGLRREMGASLVKHKDADDGRWERFGIPGRALQDEVYAEVRNDVIARANEMLATQRRAA